MSVIVQTGWKLAQAVISNGQVTGNPWSSPNNLLLVDQDVSESNPNNAASDVIIGNFNVNLPSNAVITGIEMKIFGYRGAQTSPPITLTPYAVDNTSGVDIFYPYVTPFTGLTLDYDEYVLGSSNYLFATAWTPDMINNFKLQLVANGDMYIDAAQINVFYYIPDPINPPDPVGDNCLDCNAPIQAQPFSLALPFLASDTKAYLKSFNYPDGLPIQYSDLGSCGGYIDLVFDPGKRKQQGSNFEENTFVAVWTTLPNGYVELDFVTLENRGRKFHTPYDHDADLLSDHDANSEVIISNSGHYEERFVRRCQAGIVFSEPVTVSDENVELADPATNLDFRGAGVSAVNDITNPNKKIITIPGVSVVPPGVVSVTSYTSFDQLVDTGSADLDVSGLNRGAVVQISTQEDVTIISVEVGGVPCTQQAVTTDTPNNLRNESWTCVNPPLGTQAVVVTLSAPAYLTFGAESLSEIDTSNMVGTTENNSGNDNNPTLDLTTQYTNSIVIDGLTTAQTPILYTPGPGQALNWSRTANNVTRQGASSVESAGVTPDIVTMDYDITQSTPWVMTALEINGIPAVTPIVSPLTVQDESGDTTLANVVKIVLSDTHLTSPAPGEADISFQTVDQQVNQTGNGFVLDNIIKSSGVDGEYNLSQADVAANAEVVGIVTKIIDPDNFVVATEGFVTMDTLPVGAVTGDILYLYDQNPGVLSVVAPTDPLSIVKRMGQVIDDSTNLIYFHNFLGLTQTQNNPSGGGGVDIQVFNANDTWTKPGGAKAVEIVCIGGGGGGGGGRCFYGSGASGIGGTGGGGGAVTRLIVDATKLGATETVVVSPGGAGGSGVGGTSGNGAAGSNASITKFGDWLQAGGGGGGAGGQAGGGLLGGGGGGSLDGANLATPGVPAAGNALDAIANQAASGLTTARNSEYGGASAAPAGAGGSSIFAAGAGGSGADNGGAGNGRAGGTVGAYTTGGGGAGGTSGASPTNGGAGKANSVLKKGYGGEGGGGGGGTSTNNVSAGDGGVGGFPGGGGGGGGGFTNAAATGGGSGNGGHGATGAVIVITYL